MRLTQAFFAFKKFLFCVCQVCSYRKGQHMSTLSPKSQEKIAPQRHRWWSVRRKRRKAAGLEEEMLVSIPGWHMVPSGVGGWGALSDPITKHRPLLPWDQSAVEHWHSILPRSKYEQSKIAILHPSFCDMLILIWTVNSTAVQTKSGLVVPKWRYHPTISVEHDLSTNLVMSFQKRQCQTSVWNDITQYLTGDPVPILVLVCLSW